jgi:hypothetical protein
MNLADQARNIAGRHGIVADIRGHNRRRELDKFAWSVAHRFVLL